MDTKFNVPRHIYLRFTYLLGCFSWRRHVDRETPDRYRKAVFRGTQASGYPTGCVTRNQAISSRCATSEPERTLQHKGKQSSLTWQDNHVKCQRIDAFSNWSACAGDPTNQIHGLEIWCEYFHHREWIALWSAFVTIHIHELVSGQPCRTSWRAWHLNEGW